MIGRKDCNYEEEGRQDGIVKKPWGEEVGLRVKKLFHLPLLLQKREVNQISLMYLLHFLKVLGYWKSIQDSLQLLDGWCSLCLSCPSSD
jgi:hypothetical protein